MATIVTRAGKGSPLTNTEVDANFTNLNTDKAELSGATFTGEITANGGIKIAETAGGNFLKFDVDGTADEATVGMDATDLIISVDPTNARSSSDFIIKNDGTETFRIAANGVATFVGEITANGGIALGDNDKATFGAGDDLQIFYNGTAGVIKSTTANIEVKVNGGGTFKVGDEFDNFMLAVNDNADVQLYHGATPALKLATTATGIDVTGSVVADGLTVTTASTANLGTYNYSGVDRAKIEGQQVGGAGGKLDFQTNGGAGLISRMNIDHLGDVSFYEDTGTTPKLFWDASAESLGIGTSSPSAKLEVNGGGTATSGGTLVVRQDGDTNADGIALTSSNATSHRFWKDAAGKLNVGPSNLPSALVQDLSGNVGIGESDPSGYWAQANQLVIEDGNCGLTLKSAVSGNGRLVFTDTKSTTAGLNDGGMISYSHTDDAMIVQTAGEERMRITSSGNLLVGKSNIVVAEVGHAFLEAGQQRTTANGSVTAIYNRLSSDGDIVQFRKDGTTVGSIGAEGGDLVIGTNNTGLRFYDSSSAVIPRQAGGGSSDDTLSLGASTNRFSNLYLSGGVYLGGTGAANKLDDYEEGSFTPVIADAVSGGNVASGYGNQYGYYTKVGRLVTCVFDLTNIATVGMTSANDIFIRDLPFTAASHTGNLQFTAPVIGGGSMTSALSLYAGLQDNGSAVKLINSNQTSISAFLNVSNINSGATDLRFSITYSAA